MAKKEFSVDCNICGYHATAGTEDAAYAKAAQHAGKVHGNSALGHILGTHVNVTEGTTDSET